MKQCLIKCNVKFKTIKERQQSYVIFRYLPIPVNVQILLIFHASLSYAGQGLIF